MMSTIRRNLPLTRRSAIAQINTIIARRILLHSATTTTDTDTRQQRRFPSAPPHTSAHRSKFILFSSANNKTTLSLFGAASESSCFCFYLRHTTSLRSTEKPEYVGCFDCSALAAPPTRKLISKMTPKKITTSELGLLFGILSRFLSQLGTRSDEIIKSGRPLDDCQGEIPEIPNAF